MVCIGDAGYLFSSVGLSISVGVRLNEGVSFRTFLSVV